MSKAPAAFVLAAGLGTRLAPLTHILPKPLVPVFHKPLLTFAFDSLIEALLTMCSDQIRENARHPRWPAESR